MHAAPTSLDRTFEEIAHESVAEVDRLVASLRVLPRSRNEVKRVYDYLRDDPGPRASGYCGVHLVCTYGASKPEYHGLQIELQVRTQLQHAWATAVETMDLFSGSELKYGKGEDDVMRYFAVVSSLMACEEGTAPVPGAEAPVEALLAELARLERAHGVVDRLQGYAPVVGDHATTDRRNVVTLELHRSERALQVRVHETLAEAQERLSALEARDDDLYAVLISRSGASNARTSADIR